MHCGDVQVAGNMKGILAASVSVLLFQNTVSLVSCFGYAVTIAGVVAYGHSQRAGQQATLEGKTSDIPLLTAITNDNGAVLVAGKSVHAEQQAKHIRGLHLQSFESTYESDVDVMDRIPALHRTTAAH